ncbi:MAG: DUF2703 domain-containing protein [Phycisphaerales bacterium]|nr:MAG: DUF2703 domain-containing protein [Phycisphaerales bacterium]
MRQILSCLLLLFAGAAAGCQSAPSADTSMTIHWQRMVDERGGTCDRCGLTEDAVRSAHARLKRSLAHLGISVILTTSALDMETFEESPIESNRIWIAGEPLEALIGAEVNQSPCCNACGDNDCRTMICDGRVYEAIPSELIIKAGLVAASRLVSEQ